MIRAVVPPALVRASLKHATDMLQGDRWYEHGYLTLRRFAHKVVNSATQTATQSRVCHPVSGILSALYCLVDAMQYIAISVVLEDNFMRYTTGTLKAFLLQVTPFDDKFDYQGVSVIAIAALATIGVLCLGGFHRTYLEKGRFAPTSKLVQAILIQTTQLCCYAGYMPAMFICVRTWACNTSGNSMATDTVECRSARHLGESVLALVCAVLLHHCAWNMQPILQWFDKQGYASQEDPRMIRTVVSLKLLLTFGYALVHMYDLSPNYFFVISFILFTDVSWTELSSTEVQLSPS